MGLLHRHPKALCVRHGAGPGEMREQGLSACREVALPLSATQMQMLLP